MSEDTRFLFVRFGPLPANGRSWNSRDNHAEAGVSVYEAVERDGCIQLLVPSWGDITVLTTMGMCMDGHQGRMKDPCPAFEVEGRLVGRGSDNEPLLRPCGIVRPLQPDAFAGTCG